jgi:hypothetical protein
MRRGCKLALQFTYGTLKFCVLLGILLGKFIQLFTKFGVADIKSNG